MDDSSCECILKIDRKKWEQERERERLSILSNRPLFRLKMPSLFFFYETISLSRSMRANDPSDFKNRSFLKNEDFRLFREHVRCFRISTIYTVTIFTGKSKCLRQETNTAASEWHRTLVTLTIIKRVTLEFLPISCTKTGPFLPNSLLFFFILERVEARSDVKRKV